MFSDDPSSTSLYLCQVYQSFPGDQTKYSGIKRVLSPPSQITPPPLIFLNKLKIGWGVPMIAGIPNTITQPKLK